MRLSRALLFCASLAVTVTASATAETHGFTFSRDQAGAWSCAKNAAVVAAPADRLAVNAEIRGAAAPANPSIQLRGPGVSSPQSFTSTDQRRWNADLPLSSITRGQDLIVEATLDNQTVTCGDRIQVSSTAPQNLPGADPHQRFDGDALVWWSTNAKTKLQELRETMNYPPETVFLPHLPSGAPAPSPHESAPETALLQVVALVPAGQPATSYEVTVQNCPDRDPFRIQGDLSSIGQLMSAGQQFVVVPVGEAFRCGEGRVVYTVRPIVQGAPAREDTFRLRPVYRLATTFSYGFDFTRTPSFSLDSDRKIIRRDDEAGTGLLAGFTWFPWGVDFEDMKAYNYWLNPVILFDTKAPGENFVLGNAFTPRGGLSIVVGAAIHKVTRLEGIGEGETLTGEGDIPTRKEWDRDGIGWYVSVALDQHVFGKLRNVFKKDS